MTATDLADITDAAAPHTILARMADDADVTQVETAVAGIAREVHGVVGGVAAERAEIAEFLRVTTLVVSGLLAMSVLIALVGIGNTLALSVHERRRESGLLRALGVTRRQVRAMLAVEGALLALVGATVGVGLGIGYGLAGSLALLGAARIPVILVAPAGTLVAVLGAAVLAGVLASALPGRRAARVPPAAALALE